MGGGGEGEDGGGAKGSWKPQRGADVSGRQFTRAAAGVAAAGESEGVTGPRPLIAVLNPGDMLYL